MFIHRVDEDLDITLFESLSKLETHLINETQYNSDIISTINKTEIRKRWVNFNYTNAKNVIEQFGLKLVDDGLYKPKEGILGMAVNTSWVMNNIETATTPNWEFEIRIFTDKINTVCTERKLDYKEKLRQVVAHELLHGCNVCHHGESEKRGTGGSTSEEFNKPKPGGLRSGDIYCVMRYDNAGEDKVPGYIPEYIGNRLCTSFEGTDGIQIPGEDAPKPYNKSVIQYKADGKRILHINLVNYGDAALGRGDCLHQIQVSARGGQPASCRQNEWRKFIFDIPKAKK